MAFIWVDGNPGKYVVCSDDDKAHHERTGEMPAWYQSMLRQRETASPCAPVAKAPRAGRRERPYS